MVPSGRNYKFYAIAVCLALLFALWWSIGPTDYARWEDDGLIKEALKEEQESQEVLNQGTVIYSTSSGMEGQPSDDGQRIFIDLEDNILYLVKDNKVLKKYPVAEGKYKTPSPIGSWKIISKATDWGGGFGTRWMGLNVPWGIYGIHGTNKPDSVGWASSHGCFRMRNKDIEELFSMVKVGTPVYVYGGPYGLLGNDLRPLNPGDRNSAVMEVQERLKQLGYYEGEIDGIYGEGMKAALLKYKKDHHLPYTHTVDKETYQSLNILPFE